MKELKQIRSFIQQVTTVFASVVDIEIGVIDKDLEVIAGLVILKIKWGLFTMRMYDQQADCISRRNASLSTTLK